jgi:HSP20 family molecular chaperone IbpA
MSKDKAVKKDESLQKAAGNVEMTQDRPVYVPSADIYEDGNAVTVYADMPGVNEKNVDITLEDDVLTIIGHQDAQGPDNMELVYQGYTPGIYRRSFTLGVAVDRKKISAKIKNGVLTLVLPKAAEAKPRKISVSAG